MSFAKYMNCDDFGWFACCS